MDKVSLCQPGRAAGSLAGTGGRTGTGVGMDEAWSLGISRCGPPEQTQDGTVAGPVEVEWGSRKISNVKVKSADLAGGPAQSG